MIKIEKGMGFYLIKSDIYCDLLTCIDCAKINYIFILKLYFYSEFGRDNPLTTPCRW